MLAPDTTNEGVFCANFRVDRGTLRAVRLSGASAFGACALLRLLKCAPAGGSGEL